MSVKTHWEKFKPFGIMVHIKQEINYHLWVHFLGILVVKMDAWSYKSGFFCFFFFLRNTDGGNWFFFTGEHIWHVNKKKMTRLDIYAMQQPKNLVILDVYFTSLKRFIRFLRCRAGNDEKHNRWTINRLVNQSKWNDFFVTFNI